MKAFSFLFIFSSLVLLASAVQAEENIGSLSNSNEWVVVLEDPRPARLKGWQRGSYSSSRDYKGAFELKRSGKRVARKYGLEVSAEWFIDSIDVYCLVVEIDSDAEQTLARLGRDKAVKWVQPSNRFDLMTAHRIKSDSQNLFIAPELNLPESINGSGVVVAMVDSGVDDQHPDIKSAISLNMDFVGNEPDTIVAETHGTAVAGTIVADRKSDLGVTGVASGVELKAYRGCWEQFANDSNNQSCSTLSLARALDSVARSEVDILNLSLSGPKDLLLDSIITRITASGTQVIAAHDENRSDVERFPTPAPFVLIVAEQVGDKAHNSFSAPGVRVVAYPGKKAGLMQGSSIATAYTSGVMALCAQVEKKLGKEICLPAVAFDGSQRRANSVAELISVLETELSRSQESLSKPIH